MGFDEQNQQVTYDYTVLNTKVKQWDYLTTNSHHFVTFLDMCGHVKYLKTTMYGMVGYMPDYSMVVVGANKGLNERDMTIEHLIIARILKIPIFFVVTKIDHPEGIANYGTTLEMIKANVNSSRNNPDPVKPVPEVIARDAKLSE